MNEEPKRVNRIRKKKHTRRAIWAILLLLITGGCLFILVSGKNLFSEHTAKNRVIDSFSGSMESSTIESTSTSNTDVENRNNSDSDKIAEYNQLSVPLKVLLATTIVDKRAETPGLQGYTLYYNFDNNILFVQVNSGAGSGHPIIKLAYDDNSITPIEGIIDHGKNFPVSTTPVSKKNLYDKYINNKEKYDESLTKVQLTNSLNESNYKRRKQNSSTDVSQGAKTNNQDLDVDAITKGDFSSLVGKWKNGKGDVLVIDSYGTVNGNQKITPIKNFDINNKVPYVNINSIPEGSGAAVGLYKIGIINPKGDSSDTTKPRLIVTQQESNYPANEYYYRQ